MSRRRSAPLGLVLAACLAGGAGAQSMEHPCDNRAGWPEKSSRADKQPVTSDDGLYYSAAFDFLTMQSDKVKSIPAVARLFNKAGVAPEARNPREKVEQVDKECAAMEQEQFFQCDAVLNRAY